MIQMDKMEEMLARFMDGQTTEEEESLLADYFHTVENIPEEWKSYQEMFLSFDTDAYAFSEQELDAMCADYGSSRKKLRWGIAASIAILLGIGGAAYYQMMSPNKPCVEQVATSTTTPAANTAKEIVAVKEQAPKTTEIETGKTTYKKKTVSKKSIPIAVDHAEVSEEKNEAYAVENESLDMTDYTASCASPYAVDFDFIDSEIPASSEILISQNQ